MFKTLLLCFIVIPVLLFLSCKKEDSITNSPIDVDVPLSWKSSAEFTSSPYSPTNDSNNAEWFNKNYIDNSWNESVVMPNKNWGCNECDKYFRGSFTVNTGELTTMSFNMDFHSDDGIWIYVNGSFIGHYGGNIHQGGCVNMDEWYCAINPRVSPIKINDYLIEGINNVSVHVSDAFETEYFKLNIDKNN